MFVDVSTAYLLYGAHPMDLAGVVLVAFSSITVLLACVPLFDALRSSGPKRAAAILVAPLALFSLLHLAQAGRYCLGFSNVTSRDVFPYGVYFAPQLLVSSIADLSAGPTDGPASNSVLVCPAVTQLLRSTNIPGLVAYATTADGFERRQSNILQPGLIVDYGYGINGGVWVPAPAAAGISTVPVPGPNQAVVTKTMAGPIVWDSNDGPSVPRKLTQIKRSSDSVLFHDGHAWAAWNRPSERLSGARHGRFNRLLNVDTGLTNVLCADGSARTVPRKELPSAGLGHWLGDRGGMRPGQTLIFGLGQMY